MIKLAPSILASNLSRLGEEILLIDRSDADYIHIDVMDGHFVPNITFGMPVIQKIRNLTSKIFDVHLMIDNCDKYIENFSDCGADIINVHVEACNDLTKVIRKIKSINKIPAVTVKPNTNIESVYNVLDEVNMVLIMSVEPGFGGQKFMHEALIKSEKLANYILNKNLNTDIEMDGGITLENARDVINSGVNILVAGSSVFKENGIDTLKCIKEFYDIFRECEKKL